MNKILIANRGEVARRVIDSCRKLGIATVAVFSDADRNALHVQEADEAVYIGPSSAELSYNNIDAVLTAALATDADGIHPGYGFLAENPAFASAVLAAGLVWIGPGPAAMETMASKIGARAVAAQNNIPVIPGIALAGDDNVDCEEIAKTMGFPLLIKSSSGGGGIGMRVVATQDELGTAIDAARHHSMHQFGCEDLLLERFIVNGRHIEVQVVGDQHGKLLHLFERDCSTQRRRQKLLEETPAPGLSAELRGSLHAAALRLAKAVDYHGVGTIEFMVEEDTFYLLEMNTRLQVEHPVTEAICGLDLVELQIEIARGNRLPMEQTDIRSHGHAIEARVYAEDPASGFQPATGTIMAFSLNEDSCTQSLRVDSGVAAGDVVSHHYDGMLCKLIAHGDNRELATQKLRSALTGLCIAGIQSNQQLLGAVLGSSQWRAGMRTTTLENQLSEFLTAAAPSPDALNLALAAATIWQFQNHPPAADRQPWPGGYHRQRQSSWSVSGQLFETHWQWMTAREFAFPDLELTIKLLDAPSDANRLLLEINNQRLEFEVVDEFGTLWIWQRNLGNLEVQVVSSTAYKVSDGRAGHCTSLGPGQVLRVMVIPGQEVAVGDALVIIESMKMESTIAAPCSGRVIEVPVSENELIESGQLLVRLQPSGETEV
ncbi:MAG: acetyl/propionyl-CoA carboxylase alpha subunit [Halieaceae bacterium]|jgi:acetyl/propionyl-CoA carboxylase alpha subunit